MFHKNTIVSLKNSIYNHNEYIIYLISRPRALNSLLLCTGNWLTLEVDLYRYWVKIFFENLIKVMNLGRVPPNALSDN